MGKNEISYIGRNTAERPFSFYGAGKLLITGEYLVLDGAEALAVGLSVGQTLEVSAHGQDGVLLWSSLENDGKCWFSAAFDSRLDIIRTSDEKTAGILASFLKVCLKYNPGFDFTGKNVSVRAGFDRLWGLGTSSTLMYVLGRWAGIDPFLILNEAFSGSGYDIACAGLKKRNAVVYKLENGHPAWEETDFRPPFSDNLYFVYSGHKKNSERAVRSYRELPRAGRMAAVEECTRITRAMLSCGTPDEFDYLVHEHENIVSGVTGMPALKDRLFPDFTGAVKSLGAWGGDFFLATGAEAPGYFRRRGYGTVLSWDSLVLDTVR